MQFKDNLSSVWTSTGFVGKDLTAYAERLVTSETRQGVFMLSLFALLLLGGAAVVCAVFGTDDNEVYTYAALAALSLHILLSAKSTSAIRVLYLLGTALLVIIGLGLVLLAHQSGSFSGSLFAAVALLFMVLPMVPWGLRDAAVVTLLIYGMFTASTLAVWGRFRPETLWTLQFLMVSAGVVSLLLVIRAVSMRKHHIEARFELEHKERELRQLAEIDPLTGVQNRRALETRLPTLLREAREQNVEVCLAVLDIDHFKAFNDAHGHQSGDALLRLLSSRFSGELAPGEIMVRMGGDEFALALRGAQSRVRLERAAQDFQDAARTLIGKPDQAFTLSIGYTRIDPGAEIPLSHAYGEADAALYRAKYAGRGRIEQYVPEPPGPLAPRLRRDAGRAQGSAAEAATRRVLPVAG